MILILVCLQCNAYHYVCDCCRVVGVPICVFKLCAIPRIRLWSPIGACSCRFALNVDASKLYLAPFARCQNLASPHQLCKCSATSYMNALCYEQKTSNARKTRQAWLVWQARHTNVLGNSSLSFWAHLECDRGRLMFKWICLAIDSAARSPVYNVCAFPNWKQYFDLAMLCN